MPGSALRLKGVMKNPQQSPIFFHDKRGLRFRVKGFGFRVKGFGFRV